MGDDTAKLKYWIRKVLNCPTAPFREDGIAQIVKLFARKRGLRCRSDRAGNLVVEYRREGARISPVAFSCHMDHPGFEVTESRGRRAEANLLGGVDRKTLTGSSLVLYSGGQAVRARTTSVKMASDRRRELTTLKLSCEEPVERGAWGHFDLPALDLRGGQIRSRALDNVLSVALILALLDKLCSRRRKAHVYGVFTVAEEVGFFGAAALGKGRLLPRSVPLVVMETSSEKPSFKIGDGPVVRVGDRLSVYDHEITHWLSQTASRLAENDSSFRWQRALMPGGACEASLFQLAGWKCGALALALGNYHNMGPEGAEMEYVSLRDANEMLILLDALSRRGPDPRAAAKLRHRLEHSHRRFRGRIRQRGSKR